MKNRTQERLLCLQLQHHKRDRSGAQENGVTLSFDYSDRAHDELSWWDDIEFALNGRRYMVWWEHPRQVYEDAIESQAYQAAGAPPDDDWISGSPLKHYKRQGASRKKVIAYTCPEPSAESERYYEKLSEIETRLKDEGIDLTVRPSLQRSRNTFCTGISLVAPVEIRSRADAMALAELAKRLVLGLTTLEAEFPGYEYGREMWLSDKQHF